MSAPREGREGRVEIYYSTLLYTSIIVQTPTLMFSPGAGREGEDKVLLSTLPLLEGTACYTILFLAPAEGSGLWLKNSFFCCLFA